MALIIPHSSIIPFQCSVSDQNLTKISHFPTEKPYRNSAFLPQNLNPNPPGGAYLNATMAAATLRWINWPPISARY